MNNLSQADREAINQLNNGLRIKKSITKVSYPWIAKILTMKDNQVQALTIQSSMEASSIKKGQHEAFTKKMLKAKVSGTSVEVTQAELVKRKKEGKPIQYIDVFVVKQPCQEGHTLRVVANSKLKNPTQGIQKMIAWFLSLTQLPLLLKFYYGGRQTGIC